MKLTTMQCWALLAAVPLLASCAKRSEIKAIAAAPQAVPTPAATTAEELPAKRGHYTVKKGDSLWSIAAKPSVLDDAFHWPLLYKQNRDEIQDPDLIEPAQRLQYRLHYEAAELTSATQEAQARPDYVPKKAVDGPKPPRD